MSLRPILLLQLNWGCMPSVAESTWVPQATLQGAFHPDEEWGTVGGALLLAASISFSCSSRFDNIDLTQVWLDEESMRKVISKITEIRS